MGSSGADKIPCISDRERNGVYRNRITYSLPTCVTNWYEDMALVNAKKNVILHNQCSGQLTVQRIKRIISNLLVKTDLATEDLNIRYGANYQIHSCLPSKLENYAGRKHIAHVCLAGLMKEHNLNIEGKFVNGCTLSGCLDRDPCCRNTFVFEPVNSALKNQAVRLGDNVYIKIHESGSHTPLYVQYQTATFDDIGNIVPLRLSVVPDCYCLFKFLHWYPPHRLDTIGSVFKPNTKVLIQHVQTGQNLNLEHQKWIPTFFGNEIIVTCRTVQDIHRLESAENVWTVTGNKPINMGLYVRAARGEDIPEELLV